MLLAAATTAILATGAFMALRPTAQPAGAPRPNAADATPPSVLVAQADTRPKTGDGLPPTAAPVPALKPDPAKWMKLDPQADCWESRGLSQAGDAWQVASSRLRSKQGFSDCAIRARLDAPSRSQGLAIRIMEEGFYQLSLKGDDVQLIRVKTSADPFVYENLKVFKGAAANLPREGFVLGLSAAGEVLTATLEDKELGSVSDASFAKGAIGCVAAAEATFRDIEYQIFDNAVPVTVAAAAPAAPLPTELVTLKEQYDALVIERVSGIYGADVAKLNTGYLAGLDRAATTAQSAGELDTVLALQEESKRVKAAGAASPLSATDDAKAPAALATLRGIYRNSLTKLDEQRATNHQTLLSPYTTRLKQLETDFTKAGRIADAVAVKTYREGLGAIADAAPTAPAAPAQTQAPVAQPTTTKLKLPKEDPRAIAEWILAVGGDVRVEQGGYLVRIKPGEALPKGRLIVKEVGMTFMSKAPKLPINDQEMDRLAGLEELAFLVINNLDITSAGLRFLTACPKLTNVSLHNVRPGDEGFRYLAGLENLRVLDFNSPDRITGGQLKTIAHLPIEMLGLAACSLTDADLQPLGEFTSLKELVLRFNPAVGDASIASIKACKKLEFLDITGTQITLAAMADLGRLPLNTLYCGQPDTKWDLDTFRMLAGLFPKLTAFGFPGDGPVSGTDLQLLAQVLPDLKSVYLRASKIQDGALAAFASLPKLESVYFYKAKNLTDDMIGDLVTAKKLVEVDAFGTSLTDKSLDHFAKMKSLRKLVLGSTQITEAGVAAFKKTRPEVQVSR